MEKVVDYSDNICATIVPMDYLPMGVIITVHVVYSWVRLLLIDPILPEDSIVSSRSVKGNYQGGSFVINAEFIFP